MLCNRLADEGRNVHNEPRLMTGDRVEYAAWLEVVLNDAGPPTTATAADAVHGRDKGIAATDIAKMLTGRLGRLNKAIGVKITAIVGTMYAASEAVELPDGEHIAVAEMVEAFQSWLLTRHRRSGTTFRRWAALLQAAAARRQQSIRSPSWGRRRVKTNGP